MQEQQTPSRCQVSSLNINKIQDNQPLLNYAKSISIKCHQFTIHFLQQLKYYDQNKLAPPQFLSILCNSFKYKIIQTQQPICAKILNAGSFAFKCLQCQNQDNSIICIQCFNKSNHAGHSYQKISISGGCCDCGDDQKWKDSGSCTDHNRKDIQINVNQKDTQTFIKQMQYVIQLAFVFSFFPVLNNHKAYFAKYMQSFVQFLSKFNVKSMISNQMTFRLFKSGFEKHVLINHAGRSFGLKPTMFSYLCRFYSNKNYSRLLNDLFILMFPITEFKKYLIQQYSKITMSKPMILKSQLSNISCQIYTSHKLIQQMLDQKKLKPIELQPSSLDQLKFQQIADIYSRHYLDLIYLSNLYNNVGQTYMNYHFTNVNMSGLGGYQRHVRKDWQDSINYYGMECIYVNRVVELFKYMKKNQQINAKCIKDLIKYIESRDQQLSLNYYITQQKTLILLIFIYTNGDIEKAAKNQKLLKQFGFTYENVFRILQAVLYLYRFYAVNLSNRQTVERFYTFYSFTVSKRTRTLLSLDMKMYRFCILALSTLDSQKKDIQYEPHMLASYQAPSTFKQGLMSVSELISFPIMHVYSSIENIVQNDEGAYDRRKALGMLTDYIGLLHETIISSQPQLLIKNTLKFVEGTQNKFINFYGSFIKSLGSVKYEQLKQILKIFIGDQPAFLQKFLKQFCIAQNKKISLRKEKQDQFCIFNFQYYKSFKVCQPLIPCMTQNLKKVSLEHKISEQKSQYLQPLKKQTFNEIFIDILVKIAISYRQLLQNFSSIRKTDINNYQRYLQQLLKLNNTINNKKITNLLIQVKENKQLMQGFLQTFRKNLLQTVGQSQIIEEVKNSENLVLSAQKKKMQQLKNKKLEKFKSKQNKAMDSIRKQSAELMNNISQQQKHYMQCMFCKLSNQSQPLSILCFQQKSNLFSTKYLGCKREVNFITTCNHYSHISCNSTVNPGRQYIFCNFCKSSSNYLLLINQKKQQIKKEQLQIEDLYLSGNSSDPQQEQSIKKIKKWNFKLIKSKSQDFRKKRKQVLQLQQQDLSSSQKQIQTIGLLIVYGVIVDYQFFVKSLSKVCYFMFRNLLNKKIQIDSLIKQLTKQKNQAHLDEQKILFWNAYKFSILSIAALLAVKHDSTDKEWDIRYLQQSIPSQLFQSIAFILSSIKQHDNLKNLQQKMIVPLKPISLIKLPQNLEQLSTLMGQCPCCKRTTNQIAICMICSFKSCVGCQQINLVQHSTREHGTSSIFIRVDEGWIIYVTQKKNRHYDPVYLNFVGQSFSLFKGSKDKKQFKLDQQNYNKVKADIIRHRIQQQIRYIEMTTGKTSELVP